MMKTIYKYELSLNQPFIKMPKGAEILSVQTQNDTPFIWALVNPENELKEKVIEVFGTGHEISCEGISRVFIGTFQLHESSLVFHVFERI